MAEKPGRGPSRGCEFALAEMEDAGALAAAFGAQATETNLLTQRTLRFAGSKVPVNDE